MTASNLKDDNKVMFTLIVPVGQSAYSEAERSHEQVNQLEAFPLEENPLPVKPDPDLDKEKKTIMVVDDDSEVAYYLDMLLGSDYQVVCRFNAESALEAITENAPDLILSDVVMPGKDGYWLCREIKESLQLCHIPVILVTAKTTIENQVEGLLEMHGRGMDDKSCYDYDVSGKVSMKALYEKHTMSGEEIKILLKSILRVVKEVERYLLNVNCILMDPEYIFYTEEKYYFCYYPPKEKSLWEGFHHLSEYLVKCADYQDKECVQIVFLLHKETMKENYSLEQIIKECVKEEEENVLAEDKNTDLGTEEEKEGSTYFDRTEHDWIASQEMGSTILRETENLWTPMKRFLHRRRKPKWGDWDGLYIEEEDL